jgi:methyltransferase (TIGR00027 family)
MRPDTGSRTAVFVCQGRAAADGRLAVGVFADAYATRLLTDDERTPVLRVRAGDAPVDGRERFALASVAACAEVVTPRTVRIDQALAEALTSRRDDEAGPQVVILGAGLDARPWRLPILAGVLVLSVDHPASQEDARRRAAGLPAPACDLRHVPVDLATAPLAPAVLAGGLDPSRPTVWIWEGVIPYLEKAAVLATVQAMAGLSAPGSRLIANYQAPSLTASLGRRLSGLMARVSGVESVLADEPWRSAWTPASFADAVSRSGWTVTSDESLLDVAGAIGSPTGRSRSLANGRVAVATR